MSNQNQNKKWTLKHTFGVILAIIAGLFILAHVVLFFYCTEYGCPAIVEMGKPVKVERSNGPLPPLGK